MGAGCDETIVAGTLREKLPPIFDYLERSIAGHRFFVGDVFSIADVSVATMLVNFEHAGEKIDSGRWPELARFAADIHGRPSFAECISDERLFLQRRLAA